MKNKNAAPIITSLVITAILSVFAILSGAIYNTTIPISFMEKLGIYYLDGSFGFMDNAVLFNGTHEGFGSILKALFSQTAIAGQILTGFFLLVLFGIFALIVSSASKTNYNWTTYLCAILLPVIFLDFSNVAFFGTMFENPLILVFLLLVCGLFISIYKKNNATVIKLILLSVSVFIYSAIGVETAICSIIFGILIMRLASISHSAVTKALSIIFGAILIAESIFFTINYKNADYKQTLYNSVFYGVAKYDSVAEIGLDPKLDDFKEVYYGMKENQDEYNLEENFYNKINYSDVAKYYLTHPVNAFKLVNDQARASFFNDYKYSFMPYSTLKKLYIPTSFIFVLILSAVYIIICSLTKKRGKSIKYTCEFLIGMAVMLLVSLITSTIYNGNCDIALKTYNFSVIFDILIIFAFVGGIRILLSKSDENKKKYGITRE